LGRETEGKFMNSPERYAKHLEQSRLTEVEEC